ncbi:MBL fold metallo-hydrolase [Thermobispora bispora]|jgi:glyoxylase-like metal-dependent hydrolase (beta-lactamase superfamily II)|uniref:Beta-lactamase domain protein n=1 Tax=Thermobispora bispora (strain ATCC 19993 / DSM 43833 / CBS 139.67 / JCM 10125 / KCTC 9307 / NBRC 14880 / R51) TaxID=469371 RepID=D6Y6U6_THEBD|nr:MBL fold metallo-hydrolase [Thermobispora bispora]MBO2474764.1 MBL fold metallo-hydrolase [Actinomycetales bacterium]MDI9581372.1 MBL fold metallo-hydrolase [Thermobispora sp.]ADG89587.1 beta-lactamase domain protein [Thermobispora bispora DSM 43833]MBX6166315.1 MBL fold metallo-hydrolase [Thermobispora bispora]QSI49207.1 MBL fold metallo-hydrolase [Thermobispora bispora]
MVENAKNAGKGAGSGARNAVTPASPRQHEAWISGALPEVERVRPGLWSIPVPIPINPLRYVLVYALELPDGVAIIDAGWNTEEAYQALEAGLRTAGYAITDVKAVLVTHMHPDHYGLAGRIRETSGAWIGLHPADARLIHDRYEKDAMEKLAEEQLHLLVRCGVPQMTAQELAEASMMIRSFVSMAMPDRLIEHDERIGLPGWDLRAVWTPGHSPGHLCFADPERRLLFSGDHVLARITPNVAVHPQSAPNPLADYLDALRALDALDVEEVLPAHEYRFRELSGRIAYLIEHHEERLAEVADAVAAAPGTTCWDVTTRLTWSRPWEEIPTFMQRAANNETLAHLVLLESRGRITRTPGEPDLWYPADS